MALTPSVRVVHWNPRKALGLRVMGRSVRLGPRINNFGDLVGPLVVDRILREAGRPRAAKNGRLITVGSIMHFAKNGDVVWGTGVNGKQMHAVPKSHEVSLDIRAVRGPRTREVMISHGYQVPRVYGDPALLLPKLMPELVDRAPLFEVTVVPNLNDRALYQKTDDILDPCTELRACLDRISQSQLVVGSSLHGIIIAESLGIPARLIASASEPSFKYEDYYLGTGRPGFTPASTVKDALELGGEPPIDWDPAKLIDAFPWDMWES